MTTSASNSSECGREVVDDLQANALRIVEDASRPDVVYRPDRRLQLADGEARKRIARSMAVHGD